MPIRGILFDKDGTLIDVNATWVPIYRRMLCEQFGVGVDAANAMMRRAGYDPSTERFAANSVLASGTTRQLIDVWWPGLGEAETLGIIEMLDVSYAPLARSVLKPLLPLAPLLNDLKAMGLQVGVATNDSHRSACNHLSHLGVLELFDAVIGADSVAAPKPSGDMVRKFALTAGLEAAQIAMVGDNSHDIDEARNGGAGLAIAVLSGNAAHEDIAHLADHTLDSISTLPELLRSLADVL
jgi:phosphoglycolate phosphatase